MGKQLPVWFRRRSSISPASWCQNSPSIFALVCVVVISFYRITSLYWTSAHNFMDFQVSEAGPGNADPQQYENDPGLLRLPSIEDRTLMAESQPAFREHPEHAFDLRPSTQRRENGGDHSDRGWWVAQSSSTPSVGRLSSVESASWRTGSSHSDGTDKPYRKHLSSYSEKSSAVSSTVYLPNGQRYFKSRRIQKGSVERPWLKKKDPRETWVTVMPVVGLILGLFASGMMIWGGLKTVQSHKYCLILDERFTSWNSIVWTKEVEAGGYINGQFEMTTEENVYLQDGTLIIKPTLQDTKLIENDHYIDLRGVGCTGTTWQDCTVSTNTTNGTIVNPVMSGRVNTKLGASIKFGRVEVTAKLPAGDWLWPSITMLPINDKYGEWPQSGQIDIVQGRGNDHHYMQGGNNIVSSTLHFGPNKFNDGWWHNNVKRQNLHKPFSADWHTFGVEWSEKYIFTYIDTRLLHVMYTHFDKFFWDYGQFPLGDSNGTRFIDPWSHTGDKATPFDQDFYLIISLAVGGTNGWFEDGKSNKPWLDHSPTAKRDFWQAREKWLPTWEKQGFLQVKNARIWQQGGHNGC